MPRGNKPTRRGSVLDGLMSKIGVQKRGRPGNPYLNQHEILTLSSYVDIQKSIIQGLEESNRKLTNQINKLNSGE